MVGKISVAILAAATLVLSGASAQGITSAGGTPQAQSEAPAAPVAELHVDARTARMQLIHQVDPFYPQMARAARVQGIVVLYVAIAKDGNVMDARYFSGPPLLMHAAIDAVKQWKYKPSLLNGAPVEATTSVEIPFGLSGTAYDYLRKHPELAKKLQTLLPTNDDSIDASIGYVRIEDFETALLAARDLDIPFAQLKCAQIGGYYCLPASNNGEVSLSKAIQSLMPKRSKDDIKNAEKKAREEAKALSKSGA